MSANAGLAQKAQQLELRAFFLLCLGLLRFGCVDRARPEKQRSAKLSDRKLGVAHCCPLHSNLVGTGAFVTLPILTRWKPCISTASASSFAHPRTRLFRYSLLWRSHAHPGWWLGFATSTARFKAQNENVTRGKEHHSEGKHGADVDPLGLCERSRCRKCSMTLLPPSDAKCTSMILQGRRQGLRLLLASPLHMGDSIKMHKQLQHNARPCEHKPEIQVPGAYHNASIMVTCPTSTQTSLKQLDGWPSMAKRSDPPCSCSRNLAPTLEVICSEAWNSEYPACVS